ncbi:hypothetical protein Tco_1091596 [Tanacetum coccineum]|uniref:Uncharacterized protein n=1 Tax=Tanacetum coccineum TaxID=301880 RepID=A0ABQ5I7H4_9ASTR
MTINSNLPPQIHKAQVESLKTEKVKDENLHGMDKELRLVLIELPSLGDPSSNHIPPLLPATSPFLSSTDDSSNSDIPDTPPSPTHGTPFIKTTLSTQRSPVASGALRRQAMVLAPGQPIPHG